MIRSSSSSSGKWIVRILLPSVALLLLLRMMRDSVSHDGNPSVHTRSLLTSNQAAAAATSNSSSILLLRGLYFGTSRSWGTGLSSRHDEAFPWKVSLHTHNFAIRGTGPAYPAMCLRSLLGDDLRVDFVVFEYYEILRGPEQRLLQLAKRVRQRFPNAALIYLLIPQPEHFRHLPSQLNLKGFLTKQGVPIQGGNYESISQGDMFNATVFDQKQDWELQEPQEQRQHVLQTAREVGGTVWSPTQNLDQVPALQKVRFVGQYYFRDGIHFSVHGHNSIAMSIRNILTRQSVTRSDEVGEWDSYDDCTSWYETGSVTLPHSNNTHMYSWAKTDGPMRGGKHALEIHSAGSWIQVENPTENDLNLFLYYMVTSQHQFYPNTRLTLSSLTGGNDASFVPVMELEKILVPLDEMYNNAAVHLIKGSYVGKVKPGKHYVHLRPLETRERPFRVTGISLTEMNEGSSVEGYFQ